MQKNDLVSLALVHNEPMHAYGINAIIKETEVEQWAKISPASIYNALSRLEKDGCVSVSAEKVGNMPERKVYSITQAGKDKLKQELSEALLSLDFGEFPFYLGVTFGFGMGPNEMIGLLQNRIRDINGQTKAMQEELQHLEKQGVLNSAITVKAGIKHMQVELEAAQELIALLQKEPDFYAKLAQMFRAMKDRKANPSEGKG